MWLIENKIYAKRISNRWIDELKTKHHKEEYGVSVIWIIVFPFIMFLIIPIIYGTITGTGEWFPDR